MAGKTPFFFRFKGKAVGINAGSTMRERIRDIMKRMHLSGQATSLAHRAGTALVWIALGTPVSYLSHLFLARWLGAAEYGLFAFVMTWAPLLTIVAAFGIPTTALRFIADYGAREAWDKVHGVILGSRRLVLLGCLLVVAPVAAGLSLGGAASPTVRVGLALVPLLALLTLYQEMARAYGRLALAYLPGVARPLLLLVVAFFVARSVPLTAHTVLYLVAGVSLVVLGVQAVAFERGLPRAVREAPPDYAVRTWLHNAWPLLLITGFVTLANRIDILMIGALLSPEEVGPYFAASKTTQLVTFVLTAVNIVVAPTFAGLFAREERAALQRVANTAAHFIFWPTLLIFGALVLLATPLLGLFGPGFEAARGALIFLALGRLFDAGAGPVGNLMNMTGLQQRGLPVYVAGIILNVVLNALCIPRFGLTGAAFATAFSMAFVNYRLHALTVRHLGVSTSIVSALRRRT